MTFEGYHLVYYLILLTFLVLGGVFNLLRDDGKGNWVFCVTLSIVIALVMGLRDVSVGTDTSMYQGIFNRLSRMSDEKFMAFVKFGGDPLFRWVLKCLSGFLSFNDALIIISLTLNLLTYLFSYGVVRATGISSTPIMFILMLSSSTTFNEEINIIRAGIGTAFLGIFLLSLFCKRKWYITALWGLLAVTNHFSTSLFIIIALFVQFVRLKLNKYYMIFIAGIVLAFFGISILHLGLFAGISFERIQTYTKEMGWVRYETGFRWSFVVYNTAFAFLTYVLRNHLPELVIKFVKYYICASVLFFFWFDIPFCDRIGAFSWTVIPVIFYLPIAKAYPDNEIIKGGAILAYMLAGFIISIM